MKRKQYDDDDGRVIADMNVDGMPWTVSGLGSNRRKTNKTDEELPPMPKPTAKESFTIWLHAVLAGLLLAAIFGGLGFVFIWFCVNVWFK